MAGQNNGKSRKQARIVVVTGLSGSGKSTVIKAFEDLDYFCVDNLPVLLLPEFLRLRQEASEDLWHLALGMDIRERRFLDSYPEIFEQLHRQGASLEILFLDASDEVLQRRFNQTRRKHPLAGSGTVLEGIRAEREELKDLKRMASLVVDTSDTSVHQLKQMISRLYGVVPEQETMQVRLLSFGFKYGVPSEADIVMDVRFLANPFFVEELRSLDGSHEAVVEFVLQQEQTRKFLERFSELIKYLLPHYHEEGKRYLTIAVGCTGGRHRSVVIVEQLRQELAGQGYPVRVDHRDIAAEQV